MDRQRIEELLQTLSEADQIKLRVLHNAVIDSLEAYRNNTAVANLKNWQAAEAALDEFVERMEPAARAEPPSLPNLAAVGDHLAATGWKVSRSTLYKHHKEGKIRPEKDGRFSAATAEAYAAAHLKRTDGTRPPAEDNDARRKREAETRKAEAQAAHWELRTKIAAELYVPRELFERALAARATVLKSDLLAFCHTQAQEIVGIVDGDSEKTPELADHLASATLDFLDRYARNPQLTIHKASGG